MSPDKLAIHGGEPVRLTPWPFRAAFSDLEEKFLNEAVRYYRDKNEDPPYDGIFEQRFCKEFSDFMNGGYSDAVSTGTAACYIALSALNLPEKSDVLISPVTDSGPLCAILLLGLNPILMDSGKHSYNIDYDSFLHAITTNTSAAFIVHAAGEPVAIGPIIKEANRRNIKTIEDCSQAPGAKCCGKQKKCSSFCIEEDKSLVGTFGDISAFSTMYRKSISGGGSGGVVYTKDKELFHKSLAYADRGKTKWLSTSNSKNPGEALFPALNFNTNEFTCAISSASLSRLSETIKKRCLFLEELCKEIKKQCRVCKTSNFHNGFSPFYFTLFIDPNKVRCTKVDFFTAIAAEGISLSPKYECIISRWDFVKKFIGNQKTPNAEQFSDISANLFLNEECGDKEVNDIILAIKKVEKHFLI